MHKNDNIVQKTRGQGGSTVSIPFRLVNNYYLIYLAAGLSSINFTFTVLEKCSELCVFFIRLIKTVEFGRNMPKDCLYSDVLKVSF